MHLCLRICFSTAKALPLAFILLIIGWSYYAYVIALGFYIIPPEHVIEKAALIAIYHILLGIFLWAYAQCSFTNPIRPPKQFELSPSDWATLQDTNLSKQQRIDFLESVVRSRQLPVFTRAHGDTIRVCESCQAIKPDRAHHCSTCGMCLLKMDHHCPWVNNCVGFHNYKFFIQFLLYGALFCLFIGCSTAAYFLQFWRNGISTLQSHKFHVMFVFFTAWMFFVSLLGLGLYHLFLTARNRTTLETFRLPVFAGTGTDKRAYDVGIKANFIQVFGYCLIMWLLPLTYPNSATGLVYPTRNSRGHQLLDDCELSSDSDVEANY